MTITEWNSMRQKQFEIEFQKMRADVLLLLNAGWNFCDIVNLEPMGFDITINRIKPEYDDGWYF